VIFNFHGYPWLIHRLAYRRTNHANMHVRGYKERAHQHPTGVGDEQPDRTASTGDRRDRPGCPSLGSRAAHVKERMKEEILRHRAHAHILAWDSAEITGWRWGLGAGTEAAG